MSIIRPDLTFELSNLKPGEHLCLFYEKEPAEQLPVLVPYIHEGLARDEQVIYIADDQPVEQLSSDLEHNGIDVAAARAKDRLRLWTRAEWRQPGALDASKKARQVRALIDEAAAAGFKGIRFAVEMTWILGPSISAGELELWEAMLNELLLREFPSRMICQYNLSWLGPEILLAALHTHPVAVLGEEFCRNWFYRAPLILGSHNRASEPSSLASPIAGERISPAAELDWMTLQLRSARETEKQREELVRSRMELAEAERGRAQLARLNEALEQRVQERTASLREALRQMEEFSYSISHDLRAPLRAMQGFAKAVQEDYSERLDGRGREFLECIVRSSLRMDRLIQDILSYSRLGRLGPQLCPVALDSFARELVGQFAKLHAPHARITLDRPLLPVLGHESSLSQVLSNLLHNSVKFVASGIAPRVRLWTELRGERVRLWVEDNGIGIKPAHQGRLFRLFVRLHSQEKFEGTGLGLAIVRRSVEKMGGTVGVESDGRTGSRFWIELPAAERGPQCTTHPEPRPLHRNSPAPVQF
ncbi:MAG TPA: MEDS domain-containing protein [Verrucomicrobiae bacterium]|nr:MEDS domain-containing protein [Verrucomicrobiae bacterium]